jgi:hypothetical protein
MLTRAQIDALFPSDLPEPSHWEQRYPVRDLPAGALVTRFAPSPTGHLHIGGVYTAMIVKDLAVHSAGRYFVRVEDTDQTREVEGAADQFGRAFAYFSVEPTEDELLGEYGPYVQSRRADIYYTYAREMLRTGTAYLCFATRDDIAEITARQQAAKVPTGYYGRWATWRHASDDDVREALAAGRPYVVRFRSPGDRAHRVTYTDLIRGEITSADNVNDVVVLKSSDQPLRLPTYHFAHVVDDHLMRVEPRCRCTCSCARRWASRRSATRTSPRCSSRRAAASASCPSARIPRRRSTSTSRRVIRPRRCCITCAAWRTAGSPTCRWRMPSRRPSSCRTAAFPARFSTSSSSSTSAPTTSPR